MEIFYIIPLLNLKKKLKMSIEGDLRIIKEYLEATNIYSQEEVMTLIWPCLLGHLQKCIFLILIRWMAFILLPSYVELL